MIGFTYGNQRNWPNDQSSAFTIHIKRNHKVNFFPFCLDRDVDYWHRCGFFTVFICVKEKYIETVPKNLAHKKATKNCCISQFIIFTKKIEFFTLSTSTTGHQGMQNTLYIIKREIYLRKEAAMQRWKGPWGTSKRCLYLEKVHLFLVIKNKLKILHEMFWLSL